MEDEPVQKKRGRPRKYPELPTTTDIRRPRGRPRKYEEPEIKDAPLTNHDRITIEWKRDNLEKWREYQRNYQRQYRERNKERCAQIRRESDRRLRKYRSENEEQS